MQRTHNQCTGIFPLHSCLTEQNGTMVAYEIFIADFNGNTCISKMSTVLKLHSFRTDQKLDNTELHSTRHVPGSQDKFIFNNLAIVHDSLKLIYRPPQTLLGRSLPLMHFCFLTPFVHISKRQWRMEPLWKQATLSKFPFFCQIWTKDLLEWPSKIHAQVEHNNR